MGYSTIIAAAIIMLTGSATILTPGLTSMETIPSTITEQVQSADEKLGEAYSLGKIVEVDSHTFRLNITNTDDIALAW